jgi:hypothetical protein
VHKYTVTLEIIHYQAGLRLPVFETVRMFAINAWEAGRMALNNYLIDHPSSIEVEVKRVSLAMDREYYYEFHESRDELAEVSNGDYGGRRF